MTDLGDECNQCGSRVGKGNKTCTTEEARRCKNNKFVRGIVHRGSVYRGVSPAGGSEESRHAIYGDKLGSQTEPLPEREVEAEYENSPHVGDYIFVTEVGFTGNGKRFWHGQVGDEDEEFVIIANLYAGPPTLLFRKSGLRMTEGRKEEKGTVYKTYDGQPVQ